MAVRDSRNESVNYQQLRVGQTVFYNLSGLIAKGVISQIHHRYEPTHKGSKVFRWAGFVRIINGDRISTVRNLSGIWVLTEEDIKHAGICSSS